MRLPDYEVSAAAKRPFRGLNTVIKNRQEIAPGYAADALNWLSAKFGDHIELRRGTALLGQTRQTGSGKITGLGVGVRYDGVQIPFFTLDRKIKYYDATTDDTIEVGTDKLAAAQSGLDTWIAAYQNLAGSFVYVGGPDTSTFKIPVANPGSAVDQSTNSFRFGSFKVGQNRGIAGQRKGTTAGNQDKTGVYLSYIDHPLLSDYTQTTGEAYGTGDGATLTFAHTLVVVAGTKTCMYVSVTDGVETFQDDRNGTMNGDKGGTGTVNYATGAVSVTFATAPINLAAITCSYYTEDASTHGILDFDTGATGAGKPKIFRQDDGGGNLMAIWPFQNIEYCFHLLKTWALTTSLDDTQSTNLTYRQIGIPYIRGAWPEPEGVLCLDLSNPNEPKVRRLEIQQNTTNLTVVPTSISEALDLSAHAFDYVVAFRWGDYEIICCQEYVNAVANTYNSVMYAHNVVSGAWDKLDYRATCLAILNGTLIAGDPLSNNVFTLFSGFDDDDEVIANHWQDGDLDLGTENLKRVHYMRVRGLIQKDQQLKVSLVLDGGNAVEVYTIEGDASYVDQGVETSIGAYTLGSKVLGGGAGSTTAHPYDITFPIHTDRFQRASVRFEALEVGYVSVNSYEYKDIRDKGRHSLPTKTV